MKYPGLLLIVVAFLASCSGDRTYSVGVFNNTNHTPIKVKIQYPSPEGMKTIRFSMINIGEFKSNYFSTGINPVPEEVKITWENASGEVRSSIIELSHISIGDEQSAIIFTIDEYDASVEYLDREQFSGEWESRLERKGYK